MWDPNTIYRDRGAYHHASEGPQNEMHGAAISRKALDTVEGGC